MGRGPFYDTLLSVNESGQTQRGWAGSWSRGERTGTCDRVVGWAVRVGKCLMFKSLCGISPPCRYDGVNFFSYQSVKTDFLDHVHVNIYFLSNN